MSATSKAEFAQPRTVQRNDARMSDTSLALLYYLTDHPKSSFSVLLSLFGPERDDKNSIEAFRSRLTYMTNAGHVLMVMVCGERHYSLGDSTPLVRKSRAEVCLIDLNVATCSVRVPPDRYDRLHGPVYVPPADPCPRAGGMDFKRHASHGFFC